MPYISSETVKEIREKIKREFKEFKFSITRNHSSEVVIAIMESSHDFNTDYEQINEFYIDEHFKDKPEQAKFLNRLLEICQEVKQQEIISRDTDYGDWPNYYISLRVGKWDKPYICKNGRG